MPLIIGMGMGLGFGGRPDAYSFTSSNPITITRASAAWATNSVGNVQAFTSGQMRQTDRGLHIGQAATRLHGEFPANGFNASTTQTVLPAEGVFNPTRVASTGDTWNRWQTGNVAVTSGVLYYWRARIREGTSGRARITWRANSTESLVTGTFGSLAVTASAAGTMTIASNTLLPNGDRELVGTVLANATVANASLGIGPDSATIGEDVTVVGAQVTSEWSDWIMTGASTLAVAADDVRLDLTGVDMSAGLMIRIDGELPNVPTSGFDRFYQANDPLLPANRASCYVVGSSGAVTNDSYAAGVDQGFSNLGTATAGQFSLVGAHGPNYIGGAWNGVVATPDTVASYVTPTRLSIGSAVGTNVLPIIARRITLVPGAPTTATVTELAA